MMNNLSLIRWAGGKGKQLNDLLPLIPRTKIYVEPFGGGASVLLNKERTEIEVYNDLDSALVNLFEVVRGDDSFDEFSRLLDYTPYSREQFVTSLGFDDLPDPVQRAAAFYTVINQSISGKRLASRGDWARGRNDNLASRWFQRQEKLGWIHSRIRTVQIEARDALDILQEWDTPDTCFYCDPPYILETRTQRKYYAVEPGDDYHVRLVEVLLGVKGMVVLSGYDHPIYMELLNHGWWSDVYGAQAIMQVTKAGGTKQKRVEIVYRNPRCAEQGVRAVLPWDDDSRERILRGDLDHRAEVRVTSSSGESVVVGSPAPSPVPVPIPVPVPTWLSPPPLPSWLAEKVEAAIQARQSNETQASLLD